MRFTMNKLIIILFFTGTPFFASGQKYFEGSIEYAYEAKVKSKKIDFSRLQKAVGKGSTLYFKEGNFRHDYDGGVLEFDLYNRRENKLYTKKRGSDTIYWYDCSKKGESIKDVRISKQKTEVLQMLCDQLTIQYSDHSVVEYYNSDSIRVDPAWFAEFKRGDQFKIDAIEKSIFLQSERDYPAFSVISTATRIKKQALNTNVFEVPANAILVNKE
jgi:hypothetical protein